MALIDLEKRKKEIVDDVTTTKNDVSIAFDVMIREIQNAADEQELVKVSLHGVDRINKIMGRK